MLSTPVLPAASSALIVVTRARHCALPLEHVIETMRPLPIQPMARAPAHVLGLSIIRGRPVPVVDLGALLAAGLDGAASAHARFVTVRAGARQVALAVQAVIGVRTFRPSEVHGVPPLVAGSSSASLVALGVVDRDLVAVLDTALVLPDDVWARDFAAGT